MVQLKGALVAPGLNSKHQRVLPYAADQTTVTWNPEPALDAKGLIALQVLPFVVLAEVDGSNQHLEMRWSPPTARLAGAEGQSPPLTCATLIGMDEITAVTRVLDVQAEAPAPSSILLR